MFQKTQDNKKIGNFNLAKYSQTLVSTFYR